MTSINFETIQIKGDFRNLQECCSSINFREIHKYTFYDFLVILADTESYYQKLDSSFKGISESRISLTNQKFKVEANKRIMEYLSLLSDYKNRMEEKENYDEAQKVDEKMVEIKKREVLRQQKNIKRIQLEESLDIESLQKKKVEEFNVAWDKFMEEYEQRVSDHIERVKNQQRAEIESLESEQKEKITQKVIKPSPEVLVLRKQQYILCRLKNYPEASRVKKTADFIMKSSKGTREEFLRKELDRKLENLRARHEKQLEALSFKYEQERERQFRNRQMDFQRYNGSNEGFSC